MIKGVIFDVDGVLLNSMPVWENLGELYLDHLGIEAEKNLGETLFEMSLEEAADYQQAPGTPPGRSPSAMAEETSSTMSEGARGVFWLAYTAAESFGLRNRSITPW